MKSRLNYEKAQGLELIIGLGFQIIVHLLKHYEMSWPGEADLIIHSLTLALVDLDDFKIVNDTSGTFIREYAFKSCGVDRQNNLRETDFVSRIGGDEFAILLPNTDQKSAKIVMEKLSRNLTAFSSHIQHQCFDFWSEAIIDRQIN